MKKIIIGLIATVFMVNLSWGQNTKSEYLSKPIFRLIEKTKPALFKEIVNSNIEFKKIDGKEVVFLNLKNGYFLDNSEKMIYTEINKLDKKITVFDFLSNKSTTSNLNVNKKGVFDSISQDDTSTIDIFNPIDFNP